MMRLIMTLTEAVAALDGKAVLTAEDALEVRRIVFADGGPVTCEAAEALFKLNAAAGQLSAEWRALFVEALVELVVRQRVPAGYVDAETSTWLMDAVDRHPVREDVLDMLVHVLETADETPDALDAVVLGALKSALLERPEPRALTKADVERLRRAVFALGSEGNIEVSRREADLLFDINDVLHGEANDPAWAEFFVRAIADSVLRVQTYVELSTADELKAEAFLADTKVHPFAFLGAVLHPARTVGQFGQHDADILDMWAARNAADTAADEAARSVEADQAHWLMERMQRDGRFDANERKLVRFLVENARTIDPALHAAIAALHLTPEQLGAAAQAGAAAGAEPPSSPTETPPRPVFGRAPARA
jgi:hypothetical protein